MNRQSYKKPTTITNFMSKHKNKEMKKYLEKSSILIEKSHYGNNLDLIENFLSEVESSIIKIETDTHICYINLYHQCNDEIYKQHSIDYKFKDIKYDISSYKNGVSFRTFKSCTFEYTIDNKKSATELSFKSLAADNKILFNSIWNLHCDKENKINLEQSNLLSNFFKGKQNKISPSGLLAYSYFGGSIVLSLSAVVAYLLLNHN